MTTSTKARPSRIVAVRDTWRLVPRTELWVNVYVVGPEDGFGFSQMFSRARCKKAESLDKADLVVFTGGSFDVHPALYMVGADRVHPQVYGTGSQECTDTMLEYARVFFECVQTGTPMVGVCLGAQFLHVMHGGRLYQHVDNHNSAHPMWCRDTGQMIKNISSVHHQLCMDYNTKGVPYGFTILGTSCEADDRWINSALFDIADASDPDDEDIEAFWYSETGCFGVQGHPEYQGFDEYTEWFMTQITHSFIENPDFELVEGGIRLKEDVRNQANYTAPRLVQDFMKEYG